VLWIAGKKTLKTFVPITSKNSASVQEIILCYDLPDPVTPAKPSCAVMIGTLFEYEDIQDDLGNIYPPYPISTHRKQK
jgi:hypothetical protein